MAQEEEEEEEEENQRKKDVVGLNTSPLRLDAATSHWATTSLVMRDSRINGPPFHLRYHNAGRHRPRRCNAPMCQINQNPDGSTWPLARPFACWLALLTRSLAPHCLLCLSAPLIHLLA